MGHVIWTLASTVFLLLLVQGYSDPERHGGRRLKLCTKKNDIVIFLDTAPDTCEEKFNKILSFLVKLTRHFQIGDAHTLFSAWTTNTYPVMSFPFNEYARSLRQDKALSKINFIGSDRGIQKASKMFDVFSVNRPQGARQSAAKSLLLITDQSFSDNSAVVAETEIMKYWGFNIVVLVVGNQLQEAALGALASSANKVIVVSDFDELDREASNTAHALCDFKRSGGKCDKSDESDDRSDETSDDEQGSNDSDEDCDSDPDEDISDESDDDSDGDESEEFYDYNFDSDEACDGESNEDESDEDDSDEFFAYDYESDEDCDGYSDEDYGDEYDEGESDEFYDYESDSDENGSDGLDEECDEDGSHASHEDSDHSDEGCCNKKKITYEYDLEEDCATTNVTDSNGTTSNI